MEKIQIVIARYNENIEWAKDLSNVIIYNKGSELNSQIGSAIELFLPNVGREGHTFYKHICDNYDNLYDYIVFLQGDPFPHYKKIIEKLQTYVNNPPDFELLSDWIINSTLIGQKEFYEECENITEVYNKIFNIQLKEGEDTECIFGSGGQFIASKNLILKNPKSFYENIVKILEYHINPKEGFTVERLHKYIINGPKNIIKYEKKEQNWLD